MNTGIRQRPFRTPRGVALDFTKPAGQAVVHKLLASADVLVQNFRPGVPKRYGFDYVTGFNMTEVSVPLVTPVNSTIAYCCGRPRTGCELRVVDANDIEAMKTSHEELQQAMMAVGQAVYGAGGAGGPQEPGEPGQNGQGGPGAPSGTVEGEYREV